MNEFVPDRSARLAFVPAAHIAWADLSLRHDPARNKFVNALNNTMTVAEELRWLREGRDRPADLTDVVHGQHLRKLLRMISLLAQESESLELAIHDFSFNRPEPPVEEPASDPG
ncbi:MULTISPECIES: hypothetical protein [unclassified Crossiella]|uniref:hypothetical protein n=1 Tax=unclassified Crossiella TaxID=2620835 RepID=UPI001FFEFAA1|nr:MULTISPECIES: hypothetical protein [unclassified Crossiella]MCK2237737.1 hypothetical protein [Crossiella sp. S99.2]MCK2255023.1 hypothetical protein [Crossiella sp. S99.1]